MRLQSQSGVAGSFRASKRIKSPGRLYSNSAWWLPTWRIHRRSYLPSTCFMSWRLQNYIIYVKENTSAFMDPDSYIFYYIFIFMRLYVGCIIHVYATCTYSSIVRRLLLTLTDHLHDKRTCERYPIFPGFTQSIYRYHIKFLLICFLMTVDRWLNKSTSSLMPSEKLHYHYSSLSSAFPFKLELFNQFFINI